MALNWVIVTQERPASPNEILRLFIMLSPECIDDGEGPPNWSISVQDAGVVVLPSSVVVYKAPTKTKTSKLTSYFELLKSTSLDDIQLTVSFAVDAVSTTTLADAGAS